MNLDGSNRTRLTKNQRARYSYPEWSPHGTSIAFVSDSEDGAAIHVTNVDGTNQRRLTNPADVIRGLAWSPDGKKIAFAWASERGHSEIYVIDAGGANAKRLTSNKSRGSDHPTWSPDGSKIAYVSGQIVGQGEIYLMNPDGSNSFPLSDDPKQPSSSVGNVRWSPSPRK